MTELMDPDLDFGGEGSDAALFDNDAERYVLGAILHTGGRSLDALEGLKGSDFYRPTHEDLFGRLQAMYGRGEPVELAAVARGLTDNPIRGFPVPEIAGLMRACVTAANADWYARTIRQKARLRKLHKACLAGLNIAATCSIERVDEAVEQVRAELDAAGDDRSRSELSTFGDLFLAAMDRWESKEEGILPTGLRDLDDMLSGGLRPGHLLIIGARPAVGKSVVASVIAHTTAKGGVGTFFPSLEMSKEELTDRVVADIADVDLEKLTRRCLNENDWTKVAKAYKRSSHWPLVVIDKGNMTINEIRSRARDVARRDHKLGLIVLDYLQLVKPADSKAPRQEQVASVSRGLKLLAKELKVPIIALAQVNRASTARSDKRPMMSDLRESGSIEADADEIVLLHRDDKESPGEIEFIIEKNRHGRTGTVSMAWAPHRSRVVSFGGDDK
ncbi:replicative DNA helicase [Kineosporia babensis]|uniref:DNA 5'-3' helicase n=1 Tax=Kineosporia babensis TaxID=499548 RepID=A0A9X1N9L3_9ACTN|nr:replicative DNA helicase [Kineosporia babensis]MCD5310912.1 replicative DNA helicase [Kineosporia babensis]